MKKLEAEPVAQAAQPKVKGVKGKKKAATKSAAKEKKAAGKKSAEGAEVRKSVDKILKYTPNKSAKKETPAKSASVGKQSAAKKSTTGGKK